MNLRNKLVLITGGAKGIGLATAQRILNEGGKVILWDFNEDDLNKTVNNFKEQGFDVFSQICDVTNKEQVYRYGGKEYKNKADYDKAKAKSLKERSDTVDKKIDEIGKSSDWEISKKNSGSSFTGVLCKFDYTILGLQLFQCQIQLDMSQHPLRKSCTYRE